VKAAWDWLVSHPYTFWPIACVCIGAIIRWYRDSRAPTEREVIEIFVLGAGLVAGALGFRKALTLPDGSPETTGSLLGCLLLLLASGRGLYTLLRTRDKVVDPLNEGAASKLPPSTAAEKTEPAAK